MVQELDELRATGGFYDGHRVRAGRVGSSKKQRRWRRLVRRQLDQLVEDLERPNVLDRYLLRRKSGR